MIYTSKSKLLALFILSTFVTSCSYIETNTQIRDIAYLRFVSNISQDYTVVINDKHEFMLNPCTIKNSTGNCINDISKKLYEVTSGNINIKVTDNDKRIVLDKTMYIGSGSTAEVIW